MPRHSGLETPRAEHLVVRDRDRLGHAIDYRSRFALQSGPDRHESDVGRSPAGGLPADAVDDGEDAA